MPALTETYNPSDPKQLDDIAYNEDKARRDAMSSLWKYYEGDHKKPLKVRTGEPDDNVILNLCARVVDQSVSLLFPETLSYQLEEGEETEQEKRLGELWDYNNEPIFLNDLGTRGAVTGHNFVKILIAEDGPRLIEIDHPEVLCTAFWDPNDREEVLVYKLAWKVGDIEWRQHFAMDRNANDEPTGTWTIRDWERDRNQWALRAEEQWPFDFAPIVAWKNLPDPRGFYGSSDLREPTRNDEINFVASNTQRILKFHGHPRTVVIGAGTDKIVQTAVDGIWAINTSDASVQTIQPAPLGESISWLGELKRAFYARHQTVDMSTIHDRIGQITNFGLRTLFRDALEKLEVKRILYGDALAELSRRMLVIAGNEGAIRPQVQWPEALDLNDLEEITALKTELELGIISRETAAGLRGRDWAVEQERIDAESGGGMFERMMRSFERGE
jgi:hypothetical protein